MPTYDNRPREEHLLKPNFEKHVENKPYFIATATETIGQYVAERDPSKTLAPSQPIHKPLLDKEKPKDPIDSPFGKQPVAIIGISCKFPGGIHDLESFSEFCGKGEEAWSEFPKDRFNGDAWYHPNTDKGGSLSLKSGHFLNDDHYKRFDTNFFNISPKEAKSMDPRARMHLEGAYEAFENAGIPIAELNGSQTGVFVGAFLNDYGSLLDKDPTVNVQHRATGLGISMFANRLSYWFNLHGPSMTVDTACSASAAAVHLAFDSLQSGSSKLALASGASLILNPEAMISLNTMKFLSPDGKSYMFDSRANGYARGEGIGTIILKLLPDALRDGDTIHAIIRNTGMNQDGKTPGITLPSQEAQTKLIRQTYQEIGLSPMDTDLLEAHGTGTVAGDKAEAQALAIGLDTSTRTADKPLKVVSVKTKIGHCEAASGVAGIIHAIVALQSRTIFSNCNFACPSDEIDFENWRIKVPTSSQPWVSEQPRRVSVNSYGYGGTNVHLILEEANSRSLKHAPARLNGFREDPSSAERPRILCISANEIDSFQTLASQIKRFLETHTDRQTFLDALYTLNQRRSLHKYRYAIQGASREHFAQHLAGIQPKSARISRPPKIGFLFTGQGAQWAKMGCQLIQSYPVFSDTLKKAETHLNELGAGWKLTVELQRAALESSIDEPYLSQPLCTALQIALVELLRSWKIVPVSVAGHSSGEIAAAFAAGMLSSSSAMTIAYFRGKLCNELANSKSQTQQGAMLAVGLSEEQMAPYSADLRKAGISIACFNSPQSLTLSGGARSIDIFHEKLNQLGHFSRKLKVSVAYHSAQLEPIAEKYRRTLSAHNALFCPNEDVKFYSSVHPGIRVATDDEYWVQNMLLPVRFSDALEQMINETDEALRPDVFLEIGPHSALAAPVRQTLSNQGDKTNFEYFSTLQRGLDDHQAMLSTVSHLFNLGVKLNFGEINFPHGSESNSVLSNLPVYPWNHSTIYWHDGRHSVNCLHQEFPAHDLLGKLTHDSGTHDMKWINHLSLSQVPWLRDHKVRNEVVFPGTGYLTMAVEAARQKAMIKKSPFVSVTFREVSFMNALTFPDTMPTVEIALLLEPMRYGSNRTSDTWDVFRIISYSGGRDAIEHCYGLISCSRQFKADDLDYDDDAMVRFANGELEKSVNWVDWLPQITSGSQMGPCFKLFTGALRSSEKLVSSIQVPETASLMPMEYESRSVAGAPMLDALLQLCILHAENVADLCGDSYPTYVKDFSFSLDLPKNAGEILWAESRTHAHTPRDFEGCCVSLISNEAGEMIPLAKMMGVRFFATRRQISIGNDDSYDPNLCTCLIWGPDVDYLSQSDAERLWGHGYISPEQESSFTLVEKAGWLCLRAAWESRACWDNGNLPKHHQYFAKWIEAKYDAGKSGNLVLQSPDWDVVDNSAIEETLDAASSLGPYGEMTARVGRNLPKILAQVIDPLSLMLEDGLLDKFYGAFLNQEKVNEKASQYMDSFGLKFPGQKILEIGAGTGAATTWILKAVGGADGQRQRFSTYTFTDISAGFFEKARAKFETYGDSMRFRTLNIENDPVSEGFTEQYDVIIAVNVLHATAHMERTMRHVNALLRPGGKLVLVELTNLVGLGTNLVFGTLPGWWLGVDEGRTDSPALSEPAWKTLLQKTGFTDLDICLRDSEDDGMHAMSLMIATKKDQETQMELVAPHMLFVNPAQKDFCLALQASIGQGSNGKVGGSMSLLDEAVLSSGTYVLIDDPEKPLLGCLDEQQFAQLRKLFNSALGLLWVFPGGAEDSSNPTTGSVTGFLRTLRSENGGVPYIVLDLGASSQISQDMRLDVITRIYYQRFNAQAYGADTIDYEYALHDGIIEIPRLVEYEMANNFVRPSLAIKTELQPLWLDDVPRVLKMRQIGFLDSFFLAVQKPSDLRLLEGEVEICVKSAGLNFKDVLIASGTLPAPLNLGLECAGIVTRVSSEALGLRVGDRVCASGNNTFATHVKIPSCYAVKIPDDMDFCSAASLPTVFTTAYYCLYVSARLRSDETVLIHSATGGLGQACLKMAKLIGAKIIATCGSQEKVEFLQNTYGLPRAHILNSRSHRYESDVMRITKGKGVDVLINDQAGDGLREGWACMAMFGRFIDVAKRDSNENARLPMGQFAKGVTYLPVPLDLYMDHQRDIMAHALQQGVALVLEGKVTPIEPITTFKISEVEKAFRLMQSGKHVGKIVLNLDDNDAVQAVPAPKPSLKLRPEASYIIVGGLSGIGSAFALCMSEKLGASHLILLSRSGMNAKGAQELVNSLEERGVKVKVIKCDVADSENLNMLLDTCSTDMPPVRGVIQGAMVLQDAVFATQTYSKFITAQRPKIEGTWNLHNYFHSRSIPLDFFVMLSSVAGIYGSASQSNYAAGNTFQDTFAHWRRAQGLPALAIDIGFVVDVGWTASNPDLVRTGKERHEKEITSQDLMALIEYHVKTWLEHMETESQENAVAALPSAQVAIGLRTDNLPESALFSHIKASLARASPANDRAAVSAEHDSVKFKLDAVGSDKAALSEIMETALGDKMAQLLMLPRENVRLDDTFASHGVDSLVAVEIRGWVMKELGGKLAVSEILNGQKTIKDVLEETVESRLNA